MVNAKTVSLFSTDKIDYLDMATGSITVTLPVSVANEFPVMAERLTERMHDLLERNTEGQLNDLEKDELRALVEMAEFAQVFATAVHRATP